MTAAPVRSPVAASDAAAKRAIVAAAVIALLAFVPAIHGGFVYDDHRFLAENAQLRDPSILWRAFADPSCQTGNGTHAGLWRPLRTLSFALDRMLFGDGAAGPHVVNVLLHAGGTAALAALLLAWRVPALGAALGAVVYAVHPVQPECVAWISSRGDLLAAGLVWAALALDLRGRAAAALVCGVGALLSKGEQAVVWPVLVVLSRRFAGRSTAESVRAAWRPAACAILYVVVRAMVLDEATQQGGLGRGPATFAVAGSMLAFHAWTAALPVRPVFDWQMPWVTSPPWQVTAVAATLVAGLLFRPTRGAVAWFLAALVPTSLVQFVVPLNILVADRFLLFALPALALGAGRVVGSVRGAAVPVALAAAAFAGGSVRATPRWSSDETLWGHTAAAVPGHGRAEAWLGIRALRDGRVEQAEMHLGEAAAAVPDDAQVCFFLAQSQEILGNRLRDDSRVLAALANYRAALRAFASPRAEGAAELVPLAVWAEADLTLMTGDVAGARSRLDTLLASAPPALSDANRRALDARLATLAKRAEMGLDAAAAERIRAWSVRP